MGSISKRPEGHFAMVRVAHYGKVIGIGRYARIWKQQRRSTRPEVHHASREGPLSKTLPAIFTIGSKKSRAQSFYVSMRRIFKKGAVSMGEAGT